MIAVDAVVSQAREWLGVTFLHQGRSRFGCDCLGFIAACMAELGSTTLLDSLPRSYARDPQSILIDGLAGLTREISLQPGAILIAQFPLTRFPSHAAIYTGESMIHAFQSNGKVVEHGYRNPWIARTRSIWALPLVVYE